MASIKNIINPDDEYVDSSPIKKDDSPIPSFHYHQHAEASSSSSTYGISRHIPSIPSTSTSHLRMHNPASQVQQSLPNEHPSTPSPGYPGNDATDRRQSNTSVDSMDSMYHQTYSQGNSPPVSRSSKSGSSHGKQVRLTPVTGRPSRALKGLAVHTCEVCRPPKTFTRAEHLRRHKLSHQPPDLTCPRPNCDKAFHRRDLLQRHQQKHEQEDASRGQVSLPPSDVSGPWPPTSTGPRGPWIGNQDPPRYDQSMYDSAPTMVPSGWGSPSSPSNSSGGTGSPPGVAGFEAVSYGTSHPPYLASIYPHSPMYMDYPQAPPILTTTGHMGDFSEALYLNQGMNHTVRSLSPLEILQASETLVAPFPTFPRPRISPAKSCRDEAYSLAPAHAKSSSLRSDVRQAIPKYLDVYWEKVDPLYPAINRATFQGQNDISPEHLDALRCAMAAVATQFVKDRCARESGSELHAYAWNRAKTSASGNNWPLPVMQTILLCEFYGRFRGRHKISHEPSIYFAVLYEMVLLRQKNFSPVRSGANNVRQWEVWVDMESRRRLLAACFMLDVHSMSYHGQQSCAPKAVLDYQRPDELPIPMTDGTAHLWEAQDADAWSLSLGPYMSSLTMLGDHFLAVDTAAAVAQLTSFDASILLAAHALALQARPSRPTARLDELPMVKLFAHSPRASSYLAIRHVPLHALLSVSGESWVLNKKLPDMEAFVKDQKKLIQWQRSDDCGIATVFAAQALSSFLNLKAEQGLGTLDTPEAHGDLSWDEISDYWGFYVCVLICWAHGRGQNWRAQKGKSCASTATSWLREVAGTNPSQVGSYCSEQAAHKVLVLGRKVLEQDCLSGRNMLFADAVNVLQKLEEKGTQSS